MLIIDLGMVKVSDIVNTRLNTCIFAHAHRKHGCSNFIGQLIERYPGNLDAYVRDQLSSQKLTEREAGLFRVISSDQISPSSDFHCNKAIYFIHFTVYDPYLTER